MRSIDASRRVRVAVVGYGHWGPNLARNVAAGPATELRAICDVHAVARERAKQAHPTARVIASADEVLEDDDVDAVIVALPMSMHYDFALSALRARKHVLVEKPLAETVGQCDELSAEAERGELVLMVGHTFIYNAAVEAMHEYLRSGKLGDPYYVSMRRTNLGIVRSDGNAMWNLAPHDLSILCTWLEQEPVSVNATGVAHLQEGIEDVVFLTVRFEGSVLGHVHCSWLDPNKVREATIVGSAKMAVYDDVSPEAKIRLYDKGIVKRDVAARSVDGNDRTSLGRYEDFARFQMIARAGDIVIPKIDFREPLSVEVDHFGECVRRGLAPRTGPEAGRQVVAILEAAQRSLENDGRTETIAAPPRSRR